MWNPPVKNPKLVKEIDEKIGELKAILSFEDVFKGPGLLSGCCGQLLFLNYHRLHKNDNSVEELNEKILINLYENLGDIDKASFCDGLAGILWTLDHLLKFDFIEIDEDIFEQSNDGMYRALQRYSYINEYDYLHGSLGIFLYLTERGNFKPENATQFFKLFDACCLNSKEFYAWKTKIDTVENIDGYNFGLAHGLPSAIIILLKYLEKNSNESAIEIANNLKGQLDDVKSKKQNSSVFPTTITESGANYTQRLAWCYGDLGCALALFKYGNQTNNTNVINEAIDIMLHESTKRDLKESFINDSGLCHGTTSAAHIFGRAYNYTQREEFRVASEYWYEQTLKIAFHKNGLAGYQSLNNLTNKLENRHGLLEGVTGVALSLISAISNVEPRWDKCLLLS